MEERNELIKELFELHKLLADKGEIRIGYGFGKNYDRLEAQVKKLTIPVVSQPSEQLINFGKYLESKYGNISKGGVQRYIREFIKLNNCG